MILSRLIHFGFNEDDQQIIKRQSMKSGRWGIMGRERERERERERGREREEGRRRKKKKRGEERKERAKEEERKLFGIGKAGRKVH